MCIRDSSRSVHKDVIMLHEGSNETHVFTVYDGSSDAEVSLTLKCYKDASGTYEASISMSPGNKKIRPDVKTDVDNKVNRIIKFLKNPDKIIKSDSARKETKKLQLDESNRYDF